jgi:hypothetical protein
MVNVNGKSFYRGKNRPNLCWYMNERVLLVARNHRLVTLPWVELPGHAIAAR